MQINNTINEIDKQLLGSTDEVLHCGISKWTLNLTQFPEFSYSFCWSGWLTPTDQVIKTPVCSLSSPTGLQCLPSSFSKAPLPWMGCELGLDTTQHSIAWLSIWQFNFGLSNAHVVNLQSWSRFTYTCKENVWHGSLHFQGFLMLTNYFVTKIIHEVSFKSEIIMGLLNKWPNLLAEKIYIQ